jgi:demethylsterigmatocystin 6-O-methyltransferase
MKSLGHLMAMQRDEFWGDSFPVEKEIGSFEASPEKPILVDVGGGYGQQSINFKKRLPNVSGRVIVQDVPSTLSQAKPVEGIEFIEHDFFQPQTIKGAKFYYLRHIFHDWTDKDCLRILKEIIPVMGPDSRIIIDEVVLPDIGAPWQAAYMDLTMMYSLGGAERTKTEWENLLNEAGLKILQIHKYDPKMQAVIVAVPK